MNLLPKSLKCLQGLATSVLLAAMVFQLGACPCGCIEHNAWVQFLGFDTSDHDHASAADHGAGLSSISSADTHDCSGESKAQFVDNARGPRLIESPMSESVPQLVIEDFVSSNPLFGPQACHIMSFSRLEFDAARSRPALQVYQL